MSKKDHLTAYQRAIVEISPLISFATPIKQRAVLEVLYRKAIGIAVGFDVATSEIRLMFHFDEGMPMHVSLFIDRDELEAIRKILHTRVTVYTSIVMEDGRLYPITNVVDAKSSINDPSMMTRFEFLEDTLTISTTDNEIGSRMFKDVVYGLNDDEDMSV